VRSPPRHWSRRLRRHDRIVPGRRRTLPIAADSRGTWRRPVALRSGTRRCRLDEVREADGAAEDSLGTRVGHPRRRTRVGFRSVQ